MDNTCPYLKYFTDRDIRSETILNQTEEMRKWLYSNLGLYPFASMYSDYAWTGGITKVDDIPFYNEIWFKRREDLLAFTLRFGIHL